MSFGRPIQQIPRRGTTCGQLRAVRGTTLSGVRVSERDALSREGGITSMSASDVFGPYPTSEPASIRHPAITSLAAAVVAGLALWLSRASFDVAGT